MSKKMDKRDRRDKHGSAAIAYENESGKAATKKGEAAAAGPRRYDKQHYDKKQKGGGARKWKTAFVFLLYGYNFRKKTILYVD